MSTKIELEALVERKDPRLPRYVVVPADFVTALDITTTTVVEGTLNGGDLGRRTLKRWDDARWFLDLPQGLCKERGIDAGSQIQLVLKVAAELMAPELRELLESNPEARRVWSALTVNQQRMLREEILRLKQSGARRRRALRALRLPRA